jgi:exonuclease VII small subunit
MARLDEAVKRLDRAVARLEKAASRLAEREKTSRGASVAKGDYAALLETTETVAARLDAAILRLDRALEG